MRLLVLASAVAALVVAAAAVVKELQDRPTVLAPKRP